VPVRDPAAIAGRVAELLGDDAGRLAMRQRAAAYARSMTWPMVAASYLESFSRASLEHGARPAPRARSWQTVQP